ncbi:MAG: hypothetical protein JKX78_11470 [Alteromonadaceae bacterium]|nr:hypothetical protein [Alteromonadaceae bacterium]
MRQANSIFDPILSSVASTQNKSADKKTWHNLIGSSASLAIYHAALQNGISTNKAPILLITQDTPSALRLEHELSSLANNEKACDICLFPDWETLPYDSFSPHQDIISQRLTTLYQLSRMQQGVVIVPINTLLQRLAPKQFLEANSLLIKQGEKKDLHQLRQELENCGYRCVDQVMEHGEFSVRGAILDLYPMGSKTPFRLDFFDDEIDEIRLFDPDSQRSTDKVNKIELLPAHEFPTDKAAINLFRSQYREHLKTNNEKESIYHQVSNGILPNGIEYYLPLFFEQTNTLFDYLSTQTQIILHGDIDHALEQYWLDINYRYENRRYDPTRPLLPPKKLFLHRDELYLELKNFNRITIAKTLQSKETAEKELNKSTLNKSTLNKSKDSKCNNLLLNVFVKKRGIFITRSHRCQN